MTSGEIAQAALGVVIAVGGLAVLVLSRARAESPPLSIPGVGRLSAVTHAVVGISLLVAGYHLFVHAVGLAQLRAPLGIALIVAAVAIALSIVMDAMEQRGEPPA